MYNKKNKENQIVARRPIYKPSLKMYTDCPSCFARVSKISLWGNFIKCKPTDRRNNDSTYVASKRLTLTLQPLADEVLKLYIFLVFRNTERVNLPSRSDMQKFVAHLRAKKDHYFKKVKENFLFEDWKNLARYT